MKLDDVCDEIVADVSGCLGCAVVDLDTGLALAMRVVPGTLLSDAAMEVMAAASVDYFRGRTIWQLELAMSGHQGAAPGGYVREIQTSTEDTYHFMSVVPGRESTLLILITDRTANLGLGWISMRQALARLGDAALGDHTVPEPSPPAQQVPTRASQTYRGSGVERGVSADYRDVAVRGAGAAPGRPSLDSFEVYNPRWRGGRGGRGRPH